MKYGPIFRLDAGPTPTVFLCDYKLIQEASQTGGILDRPQPAGTAYINGLDSRGLAFKLKKDKQLFQEDQEF
jgi:hypothetical protein